MKYVISGYYGYGNAGDDAILTAMVDGLRRYDPEADITVIGPNRRRLEWAGEEIWEGNPDVFGRLGVRVVPRDATLQVLGAMRRADLVISGGGGLLQDQTSAGSLAYYTGHLLWARLLRRRRMVYAQGVGPLHRLGSRLLVRLALRGAVITVRDEASARLLESCGIPAQQVRVTADPVFAWYPGPRPEERPTGLAIVWRSFLASDIGLRLLRPELEEWARKRGLYPVFFALQPGRDVAELRQAGVPRERIVTQDEPHRWLEAFAACRLTLSVRYHGILFSALAGVPALGVAYDPKVEALCGQLGLPEPVPADALEPAELLRRLEALEAGAHSWRAELPSRLEGLAQRALWNAELAVAAARGEKQVSVPAAAPELSAASEALRPPVTPAPAPPPPPAAQKSAKPSSEAAEEVVAEASADIAGSGISKAPEGARVPVLGVGFDPVTMDEAADRILAWAGIGGAPAAGNSDPVRPRLAVTANPELVMQAQRDPALAQILAAADLVVADGVGIVWAARRRGRPLPGRIPGIELAEAVMARGASAGLRVFLCGSRPGVAPRAAVRLRRRFPGLQVVGAAHGYFSPEDEDVLVERIATSGAHLLLLGLGAPRQELWLGQHLPRLQVPVAMGIGGALDVWAGRVWRAPRLLRRVGLEWFWRLLWQPRRIGRMMALPRFAWRVWRERR